jgi:hypothetical protein
MSAPIFLRIKDLARMQNVCVRTVWRQAAADPDFPPLIKHSPRRTVIEAAAFDRYLNSKRLQASMRNHVDETVQQRSGGAPSVSNPRR